MYGPSLSVRGRCGCACIRAGEVASSFPALDSSGEGVDDAIVAVADERMYEFM